MKKFIFAISFLISSISIAGGGVIIGANVLEKASDRGGGGTTIVLTSEEMRTIMDTRDSGSPNSSHEVRLQLIQPFTLLDGREGIVTQDKDGNVYTLVGGGVIQEALQN